MINKTHKQMLIFETSWEVCNRVGGIYTVLSTKTSYQLQHHEVYFFGPDLGEQSDIFFKEQPSLLKSWRKSASASGLSVRVGRWLIPGRPIAILVRYEHLWDKKNEIYGQMWQSFGVQSHAAYGDYDDSCLFAYAVGEVMHSLFDHLKEQNHEHVVAHCHEWQTAFALFYLRLHCPQIATVFTTHATGIGRSIAGNGKPLYDYFEHYNGNQMAQELGMVSKHSVERAAAHYAHCFTTVSDLTARECAQLLDKPVDIVTENGFEMSFVPKGSAFAYSRRQARQELLRVAQQKSGKTLADDSLICCISGRLEWKNKGIDVFLNAIKRYSILNHPDNTPPLVAFVMVPYLEQDVRCYQDGTTVVFCPYYLNGNDEMFGMSYYDLLIGMDMTIFPSYYEPWGYTPHESIAFHVPTVTTDLSGFGLWARAQKNNTDYLTGIKPVSVIHRTDSNTDEVIDSIARILLRYNSLNYMEREQLRDTALRLALTATWNEFFDKYEQAYNIAVSRITDNN